ncbi:MAG: DUF5050 domain-containing protein, partial [Oscillospiraceae bacterium]|nr:DUF5050 domain-containing protein [Oscillospiraceae bacterium]
DAETTDSVQVGEWTYFISMDKYEQHDIEYPALFRTLGGGDPIRVSERACVKFDVSGDDVYYLDGSIIFRDHGNLYVIHPNNEQTLLEEEVSNFQIVDDKYIYFSYSYNTVGAGEEGHALHRMNLNGSEQIIAAYSAYSPGSPQFASVTMTFKGFEIKDSYVYNTYKGEDEAERFNYRMELGNPATGLEKIEYLGDTDSDEWIIYTAAHYLIHARKDGSEQIVVDDMRDLESYNSWTISDISFTSASGMDGDGNEVKLSGYWVHYNNYSKRYKMLVASPPMVRSPSTRLEVED